MILEVDVEADSEWDSSTDWASLAELAARAAIAESRHPGLGSGERIVEIGVRLTQDEPVRVLNAQWRDKDAATNVLSFPLVDSQELDGTDGHASSPELMLGDIVLALGVCRREAADKARPVADHVAHLLVHGTLHLLGFDHGDDPAAEDMEAREVRALARLGIADPYAQEEAA